MKLREKELNIGCIVCVNFLGCCYDELRDSRQPVTTWAEVVIVSIRYQATDSEGIEELASAVVRSRVLKLTRAS
jgi:hypothetical protein